MLVPKKSKICRALWFGEIKTWSSTVNNPVCSGSGVDNTASRYVNPQDLLCRQQFDEEFLDEAFFFFGSLKA